MLDMSWSEILVIVVVALVVIGPKDLPKVIREVGKWTGKARTMAREFQRSFDDMVREAELSEIREQLEKARPGNLKNTIRDAVDPDGELKRAFDLRDEDKPPGIGTKDAAAEPGVPVEMQGPPAHLPGSPPSAAEPALTETAAVRPDPTADAPRHQPPPPEHEAGFPNDHQAEPKEPAAAHADPAKHA